MRLIIAVLISLALVSLAWAASVTGPTGNTDLYIPQWDGDNTQRLKNGVMLDTDTTLAGNSDYRVSSQKALKTYIAAQIAATPVYNYPASGIARSTGSAWTTPATYSDIVALWTTCSGYLKSDGTCDTPGGTVDVSGTPANHYWAGWTDADTLKGFSITASKPVCSDANGDPAVCAGTEGVWQVADADLTSLAGGVTGLVVGAGNGNGFDAAAYSDVVSIFGSGSCSGYLKSDGSCDTPSGTLSGGAQYYLPVWTAADTLGKLAAAGTSGNPLISGGASANPSWLAIVLAGGTNTFNISNGTASLDIAAGATLNIDTSLQVATAPVVLHGKTGGSSTIAFPTALSFDGTLTDGKACTYTADGTIIHCNSTFLASDGDGSSLTGLQLDQFITQTAWRIFYSNGSGDIVELELGTDGYLFKSKGASAAPEWSNTFSAQIDDSAAQIVGNADNTKTLKIDVSTNLGTGDDVILKVPDLGGDVSDNLVTDTSTSTLTNKSIQAVRNATNETWRGNTLYFAQCAASMGFGAPAYIQSTGKPGLADADAAATMPAIGLVVVASTDADTPCTLLTHGVITDTDWNWTPGATIYVADGGAGAVTATLADISDTDDVVQVVGIAIHADSIFVSPSLTTITLE